jgi:hypothetical protein
VNDLFINLNSNKEIDNYLLSKGCKCIEDIKQQAFLNMIEKGESFIYQLHEKNKLLSYFFISCRNLNINQNKAVKFVSEDVIFNIADSEPYEEMNIDFDKLQQDEWYKGTFVEILASNNFGSIKKVEKFSGIPYKSLQRTLQITKKIIKDNGKKYIKRSHTGSL